MVDVPPLRQNIPTPAVQFLSAVSENLAQSLAGENNFINYFQLKDKQFNLNGNYSTAPLPVLAADGLDVFGVNSQIVDVWMFVRNAGTSGTTTLDLKIATTPGGAFTSIFTTLPSIAFNAGDFTWVGVALGSLYGSNYTAPAYTPPANTVRPVLNTSITNLIPAYSAIRCDLIASQGGAPDGVGIIVKYRPVN